MVYGARLTLPAQPADIKALQRFLGMVNFYRRFLPSIARTLQPLTDLLRGNPKVLVWSPAASAAFKASKRALIAAVPLVHPAPQAVLSLAVDASDTHVGGVLQQQTVRGWQPLAFFSAKLSIAEVKYSTFDRELLAAFSAIRHFRFLLEGRQFRLLTDHKPLVSAMVRVSPPWSARQQRHLAYISEFTTDIRHTPGTENVVADALSRPSEGTAGTGVKTGSCAGILPSGNGVTTVEASSSASVLPGVSSAVRPGVTYSDVADPFVTHVASSYHVVNPVTHVNPVASIDYSLLAQAQSTCPDVAVMRQSQ